MCKPISAELQWVSNPLFTANRIMRNLRVESRAISDGKIESVRKSPFNTMGQQLSDFMTSVNPLQFDNPLDFSGWTKLSRCKKMNLEMCKDELLTNSWKNQNFSVLLKCKLAQMIPLMTLVASTSFKKQMPSGVLCL